MDDGDRVSGRHTVRFVYEQHVVAAHPRQHDAPLVEGGKRHAEWLLRLLTDGVLGGPPALSQPEVTVVAATTDVGWVPGTLVSRFDLRPELGGYTALAISRRLGTLGSVRSPKMPPAMRT